MRTREGLIARRAKWGLGGPLLPAGNPLPVWVEIVLGPYVLDELSWVDDRCTYHIQACVLLTTT
jgi:hypothetical protein